VNSPQHGWDAVTTRRLAERIEYSQPVLYSHFRGKREIIGAVALQGATEMAAAVRAATATVDGPRERVAALARAYLDFAERNPAVYDAIFQLDGGLAYAQEDTPEPLKDAFAALLECLGEVVGDGIDRGCSPRCSGRPCTGLATLTRSGRLPPEYTGPRVELLVDRLAMV
jgi:AcrR family transcriptional regulator